MVFARLNLISNRERKGRTPFAAFLTIFTLVATLTSLPSSLAEAGLVVQANSTAVSSGDSGTFDVILINTGGTFAVSAFSIELSVASNSGVSFTGVTVATTHATYIFGTLQAPPFTFSSFPVQNFTASDTDMTNPGFVTLDTPGQTFGLEHVSFKVASGTPSGSVAITIVIGDNTQILDVNANPLPFSTVNGAITISGAAAVPEPSTIVSLTIAASALSVVSLRRRSVKRTGRSRIA